MLHIAEIYSQLIFKNGIEKTTKLLEEFTRRERMIKEIRRRLSERELLVYEYLLDLWASEKILKGDVEEVIITYDDFTKDTHVDWPKDYVSDVIADISEKCTCFSYGDYYLPPIFEYRLDAFDRHHIVMNDDIFDCEVGTTLLKLLTEEQK